MPRCSSSRSKPVARIKFVSILPSSDIQLLAINCTGDRVAWNPSSIASFSMPARLHFNYRVVPGCGLRRPFLMTWRACWSNYVLDQRSPSNPTTYSDRDLDLARARILELFFAALEAVEPARAVRDMLALRDGCLVVGNKTLPATNRIHVVAVGKAAAAMTQGALEALNGINVSGDVITKEGHSGAPLPPGLRVHEAGHPIPDERGVTATNFAISSLNDLDAGCVVLALISGGGSALLEAPRDGVTLADLAQTTDLLLRAGAPIEALNAVRAPLSRVKAGGLRTAAPSCVWVTLILSDVLGNDPRVIASGPTVPGASNSGLGLEVIARYGVKG